MLERRARLRAWLAMGAATLLAAPMIIGMAAPAAAATTVLTGETTEPFRTVEYTQTANCAAYESEEVPSPDQVFEAGPETPPSGTGSLSMASSDDTDLELYRTAAYDGTALADLTALQYSTFLETEGGQPQYMRLHIDTDEDGEFNHVSNGGEDVTLLFIPANNADQAAVAAGEWQTWDAFSGEWNLNGDDGPGATMTLEEYLATDPDATIVQSFPVGEGEDTDLAGGLSFILGCSADNVTTTSNLDLLVIGTSDGGVDKYDLEPEAHARSLTVTPTSGGPGTKITVTGTDCYETGTVALYKGDTKVAEATGLTPSGGTFTGELTVPSDADPAATYSVRATCADAFAYSNQAFDVTPDPATPTGANGYRMVAADGGIFTFGQRTFHGSTGNMVLNKPIVGGATDVSDYDGYWIVASDGGVFTFNAEFHGSLGGTALTSPAVEIEPTPTGNGYWIVQANGKVTAFGGAKHHGDMSTKALNKPIIGMSVAPDGLGYWLVAEDGGIFNFGSAGFFGSMGDKTLNAPVIDLAPMPDGEGYYLVGKDGGVFTFGTAQFWGSTGAMTLNQPVIAMLVLPSGAGYWLAASDGGIFSFGPQADFLGSMGGTKLNAPVLDLIN